MKRSTILFVILFAFAMTTLNRAVAADQDEDNPQPNPAAASNQPPELDAAIRALKSSLEVPVRVKAAHYLGELGPEAAPAVPALVESLRDTSPHVRIEALIALERIGPAAREAVRTLIDLLNGNEHPLKPQEHLVERVIAVLGAIGPDAADAVPSLVRYLKSDDPSRSAAAGLALARILPRDSQVLQEGLPSLVRDLNSKEPSVRGDATRALGLIGPAALPPLIELVKKRDSDPELAWNAIVAIEGMGSEAESALPVLLSALESRNEHVAAEAARALGIIRANASESVAALQKLLRNPQPLVRAYAASALGDFGPASAVSVQELLNAARDSDPDVRREAVEALGRIGPAARAAVPALITALDDPTGEVTVNAALALTRIGPEAIPFLARVVRENVKLRLLAVLIIGESEEGAKPAVGILTDALEDDDLGFVRAVILALARIGPEARAAAPALVRILADETNKLRGPAAYALGSIGDQDAIGRLEKCLEQNENPRLRILAANSLLLLDPNNDQRVKMDIPLATDGLRDRWTVMRHQSAMALRMIGPRAAPALANLTAGLQDPQETLRVDFLWTIAAIGPEAAPALPAIVRLMNVDDFPVRYAASYAAGKIGRAASPALPVLLKNLESRDEFLRFISAWAYANIAPASNEVASRCLEPLKQGLKLPDPQARAEAALALARLGAGAREAVPALKEIAGDDDLAVRNAVAEALEKITR